MTTATRLGLTAIALVAPHAAHADAKSDAKAAYQAGAAHFKAGRHARALASFERAYKLDPSPILLYNIARCAEEMGDVERARTNFELYLKRVPEAPDRADVERRIRVMQAVAERNPVAPPGAGVEARVAPPAEPPYLAYGLAGTGVVAIAIGAFLGVRATGLDDDYTAETRDPRRKQGLKDDAESAALQANVAYAAGGALLVGGVVLWLLDAPPAPVSAFIGPDMVGLHGQF